MLKVLIFDIGGVLDKVNFDDFYKEISQKYNISISEFEKKERKLRHHLDLGEYELDWFFNELNKFFFIDINESEYLEIFKKYVAWNSDLLYLLDTSFKDNYKLVILSNNSKLFIDEDQKKYLAEIFEKQYYSFELKVKKPQKDIYNYILEELGVKSNECLFIDDKMKNLIPAKNLGFKTYQYLGDNNFLNNLDEY